MGEFKWDDLRVFLAVADGGSVASGARALGVDPSTVWRRLRALEADLGARLFDRLPEGHALTPAGEALLPRARQVAEEARALARLAAGLDDTPEGWVTLTAPESVLPVLVPMVGALRASCPELRLELRLSDRHLDLARREADLALRLGLTPAPEAVGRRVCGVAWASYAPSAAPRKEAAALPRAAYGEALPGLTDAPGWGADPEDEPAVRVSSVSAMLGLLRGGGLRGMLPCFLGDAEPALARLGPPAPGTAHALWLLVHPDLRRSARVRRVLDFTLAWLLEREQDFEGLRPAR